MSPKSTRFETFGYGVRQGGSAPAQATSMTSPDVKAAEDVVVDDEDIRGILRQQITQHAAELWNLSARDYQRVVSLYKKVLDPATAPVDRQDAINELQQHEGWAQQAVALDEVRDRKIAEIESLEGDELRGYDINAGWPDLGGAQ